MVLKTIWIRLKDDDQTDRFFKEVVRFPGCKMPGSRTLLIGQKFENELKRILKKLNITQEKAEKRFDQDVIEIRLTNSF